MATSTDRKWVFGLSIDEELRWGLAEVDVTAEQGPDAYTGEFYQGRITTLPNLNKEEIPLRTAIVDGIRELQKSRKISSILRRVSHVGVSSIGVVNHNAGLLVDIRRKWWSRDGSTYLLNSHEVIRSVFPHLYDMQRDKGLVSIQNDATAKCLAYIAFSHGIDPGVLCLVNIDYGINIGVANRDGPLNVSHLHPEAGHIYPRLHPWDELNHSTLKDISGCPAHGTCFEGVATKQRIERQFPGKTFKELKKSQSKIWDVIAFYTAQICWTATVVAAPDRILISGPLIHDDDDLMHSIRSWFSRFNCGNIEEGQQPEEPYPRLPDERSGYIRLAKKLPFAAAPKIGPPPDGVIGALELGRLACSPERLRRNSSSRASR